MRRISLDLGARRERERSGAIARLAIHHHDAIAVHERTPDGVTDRPLLVAHEDHRHQLRPGPAT
jgi:hypothetical protein